MSAGDYGIELEAGKPFNFRKIALSGENCEVAKCRITKLVPGQLEQINQLMINLEA